MLSTELDFGARQVTRMERAWKFEQRTVAFLCNTQGVRCSKRIWFKMIRKADGWKIEDDMIHVATSGGWYL